MDVVAVARALHSQAQGANERRMLVLAGDRDAGYRAARSVLDGIDVALDATTLVGDRDALYCERVAQSDAGRLLGTTREAVVFDAHDALRPNALGRIVGAVNGGGLLILLVPPLDEWPDRRDWFDETLAVYPYDVGDVGGNFRRRLTETLRVHPGIAIVDVDAGIVEKDGLTDPVPRLRSSPPEPPADHAFPRAAYEACLTDDQVEAVEAFESLRNPGHAVVVEADRGRGKSSAAGIAAACLAADGDDVLITAPEYRSAREVFARAVELLDEIGRLVAVDDEDDPRRIETEAGGVVRFERPPDATDEAAGVERGPDVVVVDEAAALPVRLLDRFLSANRVAFATTIHGYEGAGRGFSVRFREHLSDARHAVTDREMVEPVRYAAGDPIEVWAFRALLLDARPPVEPLVEGATSETVTARRLSTAELLDDEHLLRESFGLLVFAHYRTEPADLARLLDAPNLSVHALTHGGHVVAVALVAEEGGLSGELRRHMHDGGRVSGHMLPDVLISQLRDEAAGIPSGIRIVRIATHHAVRSRGLGSALLSHLRSAYAGVDWLGAGYGATPDLLSFWSDNGFSTVHLATTRNDASGEYSAIMLSPLSEAGERLRDRHAEWFADRAASMLSDPLDDADPDVVRAALRSIDARVELDLSRRDWTVVAGAAYGPGLFDVAPGPFRRVAMKQFVDPEVPDALDERQERLLVSKVLQARPWSTVAGRLGYHSTGQCMRALGDAFQPLVDAYGSERAHEVRDRYVEG